MSIKAFKTNKNANYFIFLYRVLCEFYTFSMLTTYKVYDNILIYKRKQQWTSTNQESTQN